MQILYKAKIGISIFSGNRVVFVSIYIKEHKTIIQGFPKILPNSQVKNLCTL